MQKCESLIRVRQSRLAEASYMRYEMRKTHIEGSWRKTHFLCVELRGKRTTHFCVTYKYIYVRQPSLTCNKFLFYISLFLTPLLQREQTSRWATTKRHTFFPLFLLGLRIGEQRGWFHAAPCHVRYHPSRHLCLFPLLCRCHLLVSWHFSYLFRFYSLSNEKRGNRCSRQKCKDAGTLLLTPLPWTVVLGTATNPYKAQINE